MDFSGQTATRIRSIGRRLGIFPPLVRAFRRLTGSRYEQRFDAALMAAIRPGDTVWDIGANIGLYTVKFATAAGPSGAVIAFEPSPRNLQVLRDRFGGNTSVTIIPVALADKPGHATFYENRDADGVTDSLVYRSPDAIEHPVQIHRGDDFLDRYPPNVVKIDVEGFELEVVHGLSAVLKSPALRSILIEVHFGILGSRGIPEAPAMLSESLKGAGLSVTWPDSSHMVGTRIARV